MLFLLHEMKLISRIALETQSTNSWLLQQDYLFNTPAMTCSLLQCKFQEFLYLRHIHIHSIVRTFERIDLNCNNETKYLSRLRCNNTTTEK